MTRARYKLRATASQTPTTYSVTISTIPSNTAIAAGTSYSLDLSAYVGGADAGLATLSVAEVSGTLTACGLAFASSSITGASPAAGTVSLQLVAKIGGVTVATSNTFIQGVITVATPDTVAPAVAPPPTVTVVSGTQINVTTLIPSDPNADGRATGMASLQWQRAPVTAGTVGTFANIGSPVSLSVGQRPTWTTGNVGTAAGTVTQSGSGFNISVTGAGLNDEVDSFAYAATPITGPFDVFFYVPTWTSPEQWDERGGGVWQDLTATAKRYTIARFNPEFGGRGIVDSWRSTTGGIRSQGPQVTTVPTNMWLRFVRTAGSNTITGYYFDGTSWVQRSAPTVTMTDPVYLVIYGCRNFTGTATTSTVQHVSVSTLPPVTRNDTGLTAGNFYQYRAVFTDVQGNSVTGSASATVQTTTAGGGTKKWNPGYYMQYGREKPTSYFNQWANRKALYDDPSFANSTAVKGVAWTFPWSMLEGATQGDYSAGFALIDREIAYLKALPVPKRFILKVIDYAWDSTCPSVMVPAYVSSNGWVMDMATGSVPLCKVKHWLPEPQTAFNALIAAYGARYDSEPYLEGFVPQEETSIPLPAGVSGATAANVMIQNKRMVDAIAAAFPTTNVLMAVNWVNDGLADTAELMAYMATKKVGQLSVDNCPDWNIWGDQVMRGVYGGVDYRGVIPSWSGAEASEMGYNSVGPVGGYTITQLADWANNGLKASHILIDYNEFTGTAQQRWSGPSGCLAYITANPNVTYPNKPVGYP